MPNIERILVASDGSEHALHAARFAGTLASASNATVYMVCVHNEDATIMRAMPDIWPAAVPSASFDMNEIRTSIEADADKNVFATTEAAIGEGVSLSRPVHLWGQPAESICDFATEHNIDLIVLGTRGHSEFAKLLLGSVSTQVASHAPCPVTLVR